MATADERDEGPVTIEQVLRSERELLRSGVGPSGVGPSGADSGGADSSGSPLSALCISGGGIRSATFGLGVIQGLAERGLLERLDYLSTVSGGGYIGSWLTAWSRRAGGVHAVAKELASRAHKPEGALDPVRHLREYSRYLAPAAGLLSWDLWTLLAGILRNILLNWLVLMPLLTAALLIPRAYLSLLALPEWLYGEELFPDGNSVSPHYSADALDAISNFPLVDPGLVLLSGALLSYALFNTLRCLPSVGGRRHTRAEYNAKVLLPLFGAALTYLAFDSLGYLGKKFEDESPVVPVVVWSVAACACAWLMFLTFHRRPWRERLVLATSPVSLAVLVMAAGIGLTTWANTNFLLWSHNRDTQPTWAFYATLGPPAILAGFSVATILFGGLSSGFLEDEDREWLSRSSAAVLLASVAWALMAWVVLTLPSLAFEAEEGFALMALAALASGLLSRVQQPGPANVNLEAGRLARRTSVTFIVKLAPLVFVAMLAVGLSVVTNVLLSALDALDLKSTSAPAWVFDVLVDTARIDAPPAAAVHDVVSAGAVSAGAGTEVAAYGPGTARWTHHENVLNATNLLSLGVLGLGLLGASWLMSRFVNVNTFSLHGMYRDRLVRAYLGASNPGRRPNPFTDFDPTDDTALAELATVRPFHLINVTLNMVNSGRLAWQERKAASFTMSPLHCGNAELGYRDSVAYAGGISQGTAFALSGAAASPNMGYYSSALVGFIMTLFNARLGAWLGNPGRTGSQTWRHAGPRYAVRSLITEALGMTSGSSEYVYLSDGGHFENLGLYEVIRRRCRFVFVVDSSCDPDFKLGDLGNALRKIRIDFGVSVDFDGARLAAMAERKYRWAAATIRYSEVDASVPDGVLVYLKPTVLGTEPPDVKSYAANNPSFPHQSTANQSFDESQTESYRQLGLSTARDVCGTWQGGSLEELFGRLVGTAGRG